jgi:hypothetical protein
MLLADIWSSSKELFTYTLPSAASLNNAYRATKSPGSKNILKIILPVVNVSAQKNFHRWNNKEEDFVKTVFLKYGL